MPRVNNPCPEGTSTDKWLAKAKTKMMLAAPFHGSVVSQTEFFERNEIPTAATDGTIIYYNDSFVRELTLPQLCWLLAHEAEHIMMLHCFRMGKRDPKRWNYACDYSINTTSLEALVSEGIFERIEGALYKPKYAEWSSEMIYNDIDPEDVPEDTEPHILAPGQDPSDDGEGGDGDADGEGGKGKFLSEDQMKELEEQAKRKVLAAAETAKSMGKLPGEYSSLLEKLRSPTVNWVELLHRAVAGDTPEDYTFRKPNRKFIGGGLYLPSVLKTSVGNIYVWRDSSASMSEQDDRMVCSELKGIIEEVKPKKVVVVDCDTSVHEVREFLPGDNLDQISREGFGGTDPTPFFDWVEENGEDVQAIICLTDMGFYLDEKRLPSECPVTWVSVINQDPGVGNFIYIGDAV